MPERLSQTAAAKGMRARAQEYRSKGWRVNPIWLSPRSLALLDELREQASLASRGEVVNIILDRVANDMILKQELMAVTT